MNITNDHATDLKVPAATTERLGVFFVESRVHLLAFIEAQGVAPDLAEEILQDSLLKALRASPDLRDEQRLIPWFYRIIQNAIYDMHRHHARQARALDQYARAREPITSPLETALLCFCFRALLPTLKPEYRVLIEEIELKGHAPEVVAHSLGITRNNLNVRRHRARRQLRKRLESVCTACPDDDYTDCGC